jgi:monofunctional biosynthetic peptidoglycan transglycosylase
MRWAILIVLLIAGLPVLLVGALRYAPPPVTAFMLQSETRPVYYEWVPAGRIADVAGKAVVAAEDQKFWQHRGFDFEAIEKAYRHNQKRRKRRGASTITQQTAKNLFLWPGGGYLRKGIEAYFTVLIEWLWPKERILEVYLNVAEFGPGIYGVEAAARRYFGKPASALTPAEAARLAAVLPNPRRWSAARPGSYVMTRSAWVLRQMGYAPKPAARPEPEAPDGGEMPETAPPDLTVPVEAFPPEDRIPAPDSVPPPSEDVPAEIPEETGEPTAPPTGGWIIEESPGGGE